VFALLPVDGLVADGATSADLMILALEPSGAPRNGLEATLESDGGTCGPLEALGGGLYRSRFTPAASEIGGEISVRLKGKLNLRLPTRGADSGPLRLQTTWRLRTLPAPQELLRGSASPAQIVSGRDSSASLQLQLQTRDRMAAETAALDVRASAGTVSAVTALGSGSFAARWTPPAVQGPGLALVTAVDRRVADRAYTAFALPVTGSITVPVKVAPKAQALVRTKDRTFGPVKADASGTARVPLELAPGASAVLVEVAADGSTQERPLELKLPEPRRLSFFPMSASVPADARVRVPVRVFVTTADGTPDGSTAPSLSASAGTLSAPRHEGDGVWMAEWTPAESAQGGKVTLTAKLPGGSPAQQDSLPVLTTGVRAATVSVSGPAKLPEGAQQPFELTLRATSPSGTALSARTPRVSASGARLAGTGRTLPDGSVTVPMVTTGRGPVQLEARVSNPASSNPVAQLTLATSATAVTADGLSSVTVTVVALDRWGTPVGNVPLELSVEGGSLDGSLPQTVRTNPDGVASLSYTAGRARGYGAIVAKTGSLASGAPLLQVPDGLVVPTLPRAGTPEALSRAEALAREVAALTLPR
jgi:hypothetical protein